MKGTPIRDLMHVHLVTANEDMTLAELVSLLAKEMVRSVPVVDSEGKLSGIVSETDLFLKERALPFSREAGKVPTLLGRIIDEHDLEHLDTSKRVPIKDIMCGKVLTLTPDSTLADAAMQMLHSGVTMMPVIEDDKLVGVVRRVDILKAIFGDQNSDQD